MVVQLMNSRTLVPAGGHIVTTRTAIERLAYSLRLFCPKWESQPESLTLQIGALGSALEKNEVTLFFTESPTNLFLRCVDIELVSKLCHDKRALVCVDGTYAAPLNETALTLGANIVLHSATKYIGGHNDVLAGCISGLEKLISVVRNLHNILGGALNPNATYLIIRGMKTLHLRVQQQNTTALRMVEILEEHPKVRRVYYPGLASHPEHQLAKKQMKGSGGMVSFEPPTPPPAPSPAPNFPDGDVDMDEIFQVANQQEIHPNPPLQNPPHPGFFDWGQNQALVVYSPTETNLIHILGRRLRNEPINEIWMNQRNFYQHSPATLASKTLLCVI